MIRIRTIEIRHFRCIEQLSWVPNAGINCLIGPGDEGKSTVLDAIDLCLGGRRNAQFVDTDFYKLDVSKPIQIAVTIGALDDALMSLDTYGLYLRGFNAADGTVLSEPEAQAESVLTITLVVNADLEPTWRLYSERAAAQNQARKLSWAERMILAPTRLVGAGEHLDWRRGSVLNRISGTLTETSAVLAGASREARRAFGSTASSQVIETIQIVKQVAGDLGIPIGDVAAMLDAESVSFSGGTISLHDGDGVPLHDLGLGSARLLTAGLQRKADKNASVILVDEVELGLEPHRMIRLLSSFGAKEAAAPLQVFMTTHSPVAVRELSSGQLFVIRKRADRHEVLSVGVDNDIQGTVRACPEAFLARSVMACEGRTEMGLVRGVDLYRSEIGEASIMAMGAAVTDGGGDTTFKRANAFLSLGYRTLILRDDDKEPNEIESALFYANAGIVLTWGKGKALEEELFTKLSDRAVLQLIEAAVEQCGDEELINANIKSASENTLDLATCRQAVTNSSRLALGRAAKARKGWFKTVTSMESIGHQIVGPDLASCEPSFAATIEALFTWVDDA